MTVYSGYANYKASSIEWCDRLPATWDSVSLRWVCSIYAGGTPAKDVTAYWERGTVPWLNSGCVNQRHVLEVSEWITESALKNSSAKWIPRGNLVIALAGQGKTKGMVAQLGIDSTCNQSLAAIVPNSRVSNRYLFWWLDSNYQNIRNMAGGDLRDGLNLELLACITCPTPSMEEQVGIARFLDYETARIDALIEKQQQLIALLKEKRQAVISHAVTKGLNPDAPLRDSGVEWLGAVPAHWKVARLHHLSSRIGDGLHGTPNYQDGTGLYFINGNNLEAGRIAIGESAKEVPLQDFQAHQVPLSTQTVLLSINGTIGKVALYRDERIILGKSAAYINCLPALRAEFLMTFFETHHASRYYELLSTGTTISNLSLDAIRKLKIGLPSCEEQGVIVQYAIQQKERYDALILAASKLASTLQERRTALISAAVTGKIDVRNWTPPESKPERDVA